MHFTERAKLVSEFDVGVRIVLSWSNTKYKLTLGVGGPAVVGMLSELWRNVLPAWVVLVIALLPVVVFVFVHPGELPIRVVRIAHIAASIWYCVVATGLLVALATVQPLPRAWPIYLLCAAVGSVPCVIVLNRAARGRYQPLGIPEAAVTDSQVPQRRFGLTLALGPMPDAVRVVVERLVAEAQRQPQTVNARPNGFLLTGGPAGCSYLDADGEVWDLNLWDDSVHPVDDGPRKVGLIAIAVEHVPELAEWLPCRPIGALDCQVCKMTGWLQPPWPRVQCPDCNGMGWLTE